MKRIFISFLAVIFTAGLFAQEQIKKHILLANPTVGNIQTIQYLQKNGLLNLGSEDVVFTGVYSERQNYDFKKTDNYLREEKISNITLYEFSGRLPGKKVFERNVFTDRIRTLFLQSAGIFFFGGPDIPPEIYGEKNNHSVVTDPERHFFEITFLFHLLGSSRNENFEAFLEENPDYFITGFCLGLQTMNVATGGTLIQDIPAEIYGAENPGEVVKLERSRMHRNYWQKISEDTMLMNINFHPIRFTGNFFKEKVKVNSENSPLVYSSHHQAVEKAGKGFEVTAVSCDGKIVEAIAHRHYPNVFAVQFHPEIPALYQDMDKRKFHPGDTPATYHHLIGKEGLQFHRNYWRYISESLHNALH